MLAGGPSFIASNDAVYEADRYSSCACSSRARHSANSLGVPICRYHEGGEASDFGIQFPISGTDDPELYQARVMYCLFTELCSMLVLV